MRKISENIDFIYKIVQEINYADRQEDGEYYVYQLSNAFLDDTSFQLDESVKLESKFRYIIDRALAAAEVIDSVLSPETL